MSEGLQWAWVFVRIVGGAAACYWSLKAMCEAWRGR